MNKNILIIGGSYFIGRVFVMTLAQNDEYAVHLVNRGHNPLQIPGVEEYVCDRMDPEQIRRVIPPKEYYAVVDFCADFPGQIKILLENLQGSVGHYIYISTCTVYKTSYDFPKYEESPKHEAPLPGPMGDYGYNKWLLELETAEICAKLGIPYTALRPTFVYGPFNYAPRESYFFKLIMQNKAIPYPQDCLALFQFIYVKDIARILIQCLGNKKVFHKAFNLSAKELISYPKLMEVLSEVSGQKLNTSSVSIDEIETNNIPLPFPIIQHEIYSGSLIAETLDFKFTSFVDGMKESFEFYKMYVFKQ